MKSFLIKKETVFFKKVISRLNKSIYENDFSIQ